MRKYSVTEIDEMRNHIASVMLYEISVTSENFKPAVEERLRTHLLAGTTPEELAEAAETARWRCV